MSLQRPDASFPHPFYFHLYPFTLLGLKSLWQTLVCRVLPDPWATLGPSVASASCTVVDPLSFIYRLSHLTVFLYPSLGVQSKGYVLLSSFEKSLLWGGSAPQPAVYLGED